MKTFARHRPRFYHLMFFRTRIRCAPAHWERNTAEAGKPFSISFQTGMTTMKKLKLELDELLVESVQTARGITPRGTVKGNALPTLNMDCTWDVETWHATCQTCGHSCYESDCDCTLYACP